MTEIVKFEKRDELKRFLARGRYRTLIEVVLDRVGRAVQKLTHRLYPISFWYSAVVIPLLILLIGSLVSILLGERNAIRQEIIPVEILGGVLTFASLVIFATFIGSVFSNLHDNILDTIISENSLTDLQRWLGLLCNIKLNLVFSLIYGLTMGIYIVIALSRVKQGFIGYGPSVTSCLVAFTWGMPMYFLFVFLILPTRLTRYDYRLYKADPSSSEAITHLSDLLERIVYLYAVVAAGSMAYLAFAGLLASTTTVSIVTMSIIVAWLPITILFVTSQYALAKIISRAKRRTLNEIQTQIEQIQTTEDIAEKETMEKINRLMDYHDRVKGTKDSTLDLHAILSFVNSLLLPIIGFVLGNFKDIFWH
jgi:hypothetical protein